MGLVAFELGQVCLGPRVVFVARLGLDEDHELQVIMSKGIWLVSGSG